MGLTAKRAGITFYSDPSDHYSHRIRIVLAEKEAVVELISVNPHHKPEDLAHLNPYNSLPTLVDRDLCLYESKVMMEYLDERFPHPPLLPAYPAARALTRQLAYRIERDWCSLVDIILHDSNDERVLQARKTLRDSLISVAPVFAEKPYFMNDEFSIADAMLAPILWRLAYMHIDLPEKPCKPLLRYMERLFSRESFVTSLTAVERNMRH
ncbi:glutathione S-transferase N-terminal domain-containing protein [Agitococcus lubricus]|uniref:RNA polymerase-associated protein n=1 Tax=Agitococcus lubricus TaxID=1077255 RepID=A0A2T5J0S3_9GAMM|nr:glutathione S-transferase N-terminal domain-containing protein [Agitococcus lubricus]PTQ89886.1 RNA polymerase-associated protein [Agitococcus lubricus]